MTKEEYMARTNIKSVEEARGYLTQLRVLFIAVFIGMILIRTTINENVDLLIFWIYIALLIYFLVYCIKVVKAEKISKAWAGLAIIFAPISWIWFYPDITDPLKIIIGDKQPPESLPAELTKEEKEAKRKAVNKSYWKTVGWTVGIFTVLFGLLVLFLVYFT